MEPLLKLSHVSKSFALKGKRKINALQDVSLEVYAGETLGIVGESGCGKSTLARVIMGVYLSATGQVFFRGEALDLKRRKARLAFAKQAQMIFQDPYSALNPRMKVEDIVAENLDIHRKYTKEQRAQRVRELLEAVGLEEAHGARFPSEFSGGQRQRIGIARALALNPQLLVCDEPISALDVSIQSQIMNLLKQLGEKLGLTYIFIAHDLNMVHYISSRVAVMYRGQVVELATASALQAGPRHPYTKLMAQAVLTISPDRQHGGAEMPATKPLPAQGATEEGCPFARRCPQVEALCLQTRPALHEVEARHWVSCHFTHKR